MQQNHIMFLWEQTTLNLIFILVADFISATRFATQMNIEYILNDCVNAFIHACIPSRGFPANFPIRFSKQHSIPFELSYNKLIWYWLQI